VNGGFLLDTNIPSELMRLRPEPKVKGWVAAQDISALFLSVVSIGELETGFTIHARRRAADAFRGVARTPSGASVSSACFACNAGDCGAMG
jgi:predicted nucleic acid-binding protein